METDDWLRIAIAFNEPQGGDCGDIDRISEVAVVDEAEAVRAAVEELGHKAVMLPVSDPSKALHDVSSIKPSLIFNLCEGLNGDASLEMNMASLWELAGVPFTGNRSLTLGMAQDKPLAKRLFESHGIPTPPWELFRSVPEKCALRFPVIAKPACEDASLGIGADGVADSFEKLQCLVARLLAKYGGGVLAEEFIAGREFNVAILGNQPPVALPVSEIDFSQVGKDAPNITSYEAKWLEDHPLYSKTPSVCPADISPALEAKLQQTALAVYRSLMGKDYGRIDFRVDSDESVYVLEYNPNPDISPSAGFSKALRAAGMDFKRFVNTLIEINLKDAGRIYAA